MSMFGSWSWSLVFDVGSLVLLLSLWSLMVMVMVLKLVLVLRS